MYRCNDCGHEFEAARMMEESHGEIFGHCPNCLSTDFFNIDKFQCPGCWGYKEHVSDRWCRECQAATKNCMSDAILKAVRVSDLSMTNIVNLFEDVMNEETFGMEQSKLVIKCLFDGIVELAFDRGCSVFDAIEMVKDWAEGRM